MLHFLAHRRFNMIDAFGLVYAGGLWFTGHYWAAIGASVLFAFVAIQAERFDRG